MSYRDTLTELSGEAEQQAVALYLAWETGQIDDATFVAVLAAIVAAANNRAAALADLSLAATITAALQAPVPTLGLTPPADDHDRLTTAASTLLGTLTTTPDPQARVARLGRSEPLTTAARAYSEGMARSRHVTGWTRGLSPSACQLCRWWARDGRVWPDDHPLKTHKGCTCYANPVVAAAIRPVQR